MAILALIARFVVRIITRRPLYWDDLTLIIGAVCLTVATALMLKGEDDLFLGNTLQQEPSLAFSEPLDVLEHLLTDSVILVECFMAMAWTTIFAVKMSFLIFFKQLLHRLGKINIYHWVVTAMTFLTWAYLMGEMFILCPYSGYATRKSETASSPVSHAHIV